MDRIQTRDRSRQGDVHHRSVIHNQRSFSVDSLCASRPDEFRASRPLVFNEKVQQPMQMTDRRRLEGSRRLGNEGMKQKLMGEKKGSVGSSGQGRFKGAVPASAGSVFRRMFMFPIGEINAANRLGLISSFDRNDLFVGRRTQPNTFGEKKEALVPVRTIGNLNPQRHSNPVSEIVRREVERLKSNKGDVSKEKTKHQTEEGGRTLSNPGEHVAFIKATDHKLLVRSYKTKVDDVCWAQTGLVATITNGEVVPVVQNRITDARFNNLTLIPLGANKVFIRSMVGEDALEVVIGAKDFFILIFSHWKRWDFCPQTYKRGAWVRLYGIPVHAWNVNFFKLCLFDCGMFLRADSCSADKDDLILLVF
ncbi:hypothetical protein TSUD_403730 [Trifolium subterraneum]|uniref:DUF4283 domain-containing protein n=1 Tax=Trifolium subterraneum TaxID=3900 RepID=A0A2Z6PBQ2_TRISU|nr:hypothetical protein TSUD_403730 [Trifolium subterraneum]